MDEKKKKGAARLRQGEAASGAEKGRSVWGVGPARATATELEKKDVLYDHEHAFDIAIKKN